MLSLSYVQESCRRNKKKYSLGYHAWQCWRNGFLFHIRSDKQYRRHWFLPKYVLFIMVRISNEQNPIMIPGALMIGAYYKYLHWFAPTLDTEDWRSLWRIKSQTTFLQNLSFISWNKTGYCKGFWWKSFRILFCFSAVINCQAYYYFIYHSKYFLINSCILN